MNQRHVHTTPRYGPVINVGVSSMTGGIIGYSDCPDCARRETKNQALRAERDLLTDERDRALYDLEREQRAHELHHGGPR